MGLDVFEKELKLFALMTPWSTSTKCIAGLTKHTLIGQKLDAVFMVHMVW